MLDHLVLTAFPNERGDIASVVVVYEFTTRRYLIFGPNDLAQLRQRLFMADWISGFALIRKDYLLILEDMAGGSAMIHGNQYRPIWSRTNDLSQRILIGAGLRPDATATDITQTWSLEATCRGTLRRQILPSHEQVGLLMAKGEWSSALSIAMDAACAVVELVLFVERHGYVVHGDTDVVMQLGRPVPRSPLAESSLTGVRENTDYPEQQPHVESQQQGSPSPGGATPVGRGVFDAPTRDPGAGAAPAP